MTPDELSRVASDPAPRVVRNRPVVMTSSSNTTTSSSMDDFFTMGRRTNQMTPEELGRSEPTRNRPAAMNKMSNESNQQQHNLHRALEIFQRLKSIDRQERALREERVKLQDELGAILIRQNK